MANESIKNKINSKKIGTLHFIGQRYAHHEL